MEHRTLDDIKKALADRNLQAVARELECSPGSLYNLVKGRTKAISLALYFDLVKYLWGKE